MPKLSLRERAVIHAAGQKYPNEGMRTLVEQAWLAGYKAHKKDNHQKNKLTPQEVKNKESWDTLVPWND